MLYVGGGCLDASPELREFVKRTGIPVASTFMGLGAFPDSDKLGLQVSAFVLDPFLITWNTADQPSEHCTVVQLFESSQKTTVACFVLMCGACKPLHTGCSKTALCRRWGCRVQCETSTMPTRHTASIQPSQVAASLPNLSSPWQTCCLLLLMDFGAKWQHS